MLILASVITKSDIGLRYLHKHLQLVIYFYNNSAIFYLAMLKSISSIVYIRYHFSLFGKALGKLLCIKLTLSGNYVITEHT